MKHVEYIELNAIVAFIHFYTLEQVHLLVYYIKLKSHLSVCLSVRSFLVEWISAVGDLVHRSTSNLFGTKHPPSGMTKFILKVYNRLVIGTGVLKDNPFFKFLKNF